LYDENANVYSKNGVWSHLPVGDRATVSNFEMSNFVYLEQETAYFDPEKESEFAYSVFEGRTDYSLINDEEVESSVSTTGSSNATTDGATSASTKTVRDWNGEFQWLLEQPDSTEKFVALRNLVIDFNYVAIQCKFALCIILRP
jgi:hypothetical protein